MKLITLSDHAAEQHQLEREGREQRHRDAIAAWESVVQAQAQTAQARWAAMVESVRQLRLLEAAARFFPWMAAVWAAAPARPTLANPSDQEQKWASGRLGEDRVRQRLGAVLGDEWVALSGYKNRGGEMDLLLVGPSAVVALEVKYLNGLVHCNGPQWTRDKFDRYGNLVERGLAVQDQKGRAPNRQINETADALEAFLASRGQATRVRRAVVLAHDASRLGQVVNPGVDFIGALASNDFNERVLAVLSGGPAPQQKPVDVDALVDLVKRDHAHHARRQATRDGRAPRATPPAPPATAPSPSPSPSPLPSTTPNPAQTALLPDRVVLPFAGGDHAMSPFARRQVETLVRDVQALAGHHGPDPAARARVRRAVSGYLLSGARWSVLSASEGTLNPGPARDLLCSLIAECSESFDFEDRTLCAIVAPVAVRLQSDVHAGQGVDTGDPAMMALPEALMPRVVGATRVAFAARLYAGRDLYYADARKLRDLLLQIESGAEHPEAQREPKIPGTWVRAAAQPEWQLVYFLGVAVVEPGGDLLIDTDAAQRQMMGLRPHFAGAFTDLKRFAFNRHVKAQAASEGSWTLRLGVQKGETLRRRHLLEQALATLQGNPGPVALWYSHAPRDGCVRLLVSAQGQAREFKWDLLVGEPLDSFRGSLAAATPLHVPPGVDVQVGETDAFDYAEKLRASGLSWVGVS